MTKWLFLLNSMQEYIGDLFTIQTWRSLWFFMDLYLYPTNPTKSGVTCLVIGLTIYVLLHLFAKKINTIVVSGRLTNQPEVLIHREKSSNFLITNNGRHKLGTKMPSFAYFNKDLNKRSPIINLDIRENYEKRTEVHFGLSNRYTNNYQSALFQKRVPKLEGF